MVNLSATTSPFARALAAAKGAVRRMKNFTVDYNAGEFILSGIPARKGETPLRIDTGEAFKMLIRSTDFIISEDYFRHPDTGERFEPLPGHRISYTAAGIIHTYEIMPFGDEDAARPSDSTATEYRLHTKEVKTETAA